MKFLTKTIRFSRLFYILIISLFMLALVGAIAIHLISYKLPTHSLVANTPVNQSSLQYNCLDEEIVINSSVSERYSFGGFFWLAHDQLVTIPSIGSTTKQWIKTVCKEIEDGDISQKLFGKEIQEERVRLVADGFVKDPSNTGYFDDGVTPYYVEGYQRSDMVCSMFVSYEPYGTDPFLKYTFSLDCGKKSDVEEQVRLTKSLFAFFKIHGRDDTVQISRVDDDFISGQKMRTHFVVKKEKGSYRLIYEGQDAYFDCAFVEKEHIPLSIAGECINF
jgi:hypothetical protein